MTPRFDSSFFFYIPWNFSALMDAKLSTFAVMEEEAAPRIRVVILVRGQPNGCDCTKYGKRSMPRNSERVREHAARSE
jgi:hypothetical protein